MDESEVGRAEQQMPSAGVPSPAQTEQDQVAKRTAQEGLSANGAVPAAGTPQKAASQQPVDGQSTAAAQGDQTAHEEKDETTLLRRGQVCEAVVDTVHTDAVLVHLPKSQREGFAPAWDLRKLHSEFRATLEEGDHVPVRVLKDPGSPADVVVSLHQETKGQDGSPDQDWARAEELLRNGQEFEARVTGVNRGGVTVSFGDLEGFVPNSHLERSGFRDREAKAKLIGQTLSLGVLEVDRPNRRLVLSQRAPGEGSKEQVLSQLEKGQVHTGVVRSLVSYGAFVDLGGVDGLIHISEMDWRYVDHPSEVLGVGDEVEVYVLDVDRERSRISLSRKYLLPRPWDEPAAGPRDPKPRTSMVSEQVLRDHQTW